MSHCYCEEAYHCTVARLSKKLLFCRRLLFLILSWPKPSALYEMRLQVILVTVFIKSKLGNVENTCPRITQVNLDGTKPTTSYALYRRFFGRLDQQDTSERDITSLAQFLTKLDSNSYFCSCYFRETQALPARPVHRYDFNF